MSGRPDFTQGIDLVLQSLEDIKNKNFWNTYGTSQNDLTHTLVEDYTYTAVSGVGEIIGGNLLINSPTDYTCLGQVNVVIDGSVINPSYNLTDLVTKIGNDKTTIISCSYANAANTQFVLTLNKQILFKVSFGIKISVISVNQNNSYKFFYGKN